MSGYDGFTQYMRSKANKLLEQQGTQGPVSTLFSNLRININGRTEKPLHELKQFITSNGGIFDHYVNSETTLIIANQLPVMKRANSRRPILHENWLLSCVEKGMLVDYSPFLLNPGKSDKSYHLDVESYFNNSRLHFISNLKDELREFVLQYTDCSDLESYEKVLHMDFDAFFTSVSENLHPTAKGKPAVVSHGSGGTSDVASCNYKAREFGISNGMLLNKALELCPDLTILPYEFEAYRKAAYLFVGELVQLNCPIEVVSCDEAYVGICDENIFEFASSLKNRIQTVCNIPLSLGIGDNFLMAKLASKLAKPDGIFDLNSDNFEKTTEKLAIGKLPGIGRQREAELQRLGVATFVEARGLPLSQYIALFGAIQGQKLSSAFFGKDERSFETRHNSSSASIGINWGVRLGDQEDLRIFFDDLFTNAVNRIGAKNGIVESCSIKIMMSSSDLVPRKHLGHGLCDTFSRIINIDSEDKSKQKDAIYAVLTSLTLSNGSIDKLRGCTLTFKFSRRAPLSSPVLHIKDLTITKKSCSCYDLIETDKHLLDLLFYLDCGMYAEALRCIEFIAIKDPIRAAALLRHMEDITGIKLNSRMRLLA